MKKVDSNSRSGNDEAERVEIKGVDLVRYYDWSDSKPREEERARDSGREALMRKAWARLW